MNSQGLKQKSVSGFAWMLFEKVGSQLVAVLIQIILARLLLPADYGLIGYLTLFINIMDVFLKQGFTTALIQKQDADEIDFSTVFFANYLMAVLLYLIMYLIAPLVADYYHEQKLVELMRVLSLTVIIGAGSAVHSAVLTRKLEFRKGFFRGLAGTVTYGAVGVFMALKGCGVWSLVYGKLAASLVGCLVLWITVRWHPILKFSKTRLKKLFDFSSSVLGTNLLETLFHNIHALIIGRLYTSADLGYYQRGQNIPQTIMVSVDGSMTEVLYPTYSIIQDDYSKLKNALRRTIKLSMYICLPMMAGLFVTAEPLTIILLTDKWLPSVPYMRLMCIVTIFWPLAARLHALKAIGKSRLTLTISMINNAIFIILTLLLMRFGPIYIMVANVISNIIGIFTTNYFVNKYIKYSLKELLSDILPPLLLSVFMGGVVYLVSFLGFSTIATLVVQIMLGIVIYVLGSYLFRMKDFYYILGLIKTFFNRGQA